MKHNQRDARMLKTGHYVGLKFDEGWWFTQIVGTEYNEVKPFVLQNENGNRAEIAAGTAGVTTDEIEDSRERDILEPSDDERNTYHQILYGVAPSRMQIFELHGRDRNRAVQDYDEPGEPAAYTTGFDSPYNNPTRASEVFYVNSMTPLRIQAFNPTDEAFEATLSFHVNKIRYNTVTDKQLMKAMLQGQQSARLAMLGGGVQSRDQVGVPTWLSEAFSEHIYTTEEILNSGSSGLGDNRLPSGGATAGTGGGN